MVVDDSDDNTVISIAIVVVAVVDVVVGVVVGVGVGAAVTLLLAGHRKDTLYRGQCSSVCVVVAVTILDAHVTPSSYKSMSVCVRVCVCTYIPEYFHVRRVTNLVPSVNTCQSSAR